VAEFIEDLEEVADGPGDPVRSLDQQHLETAATRISKEFIETHSRKGFAGFATDNSSVAAM
jgi:diaminopimelate decarboxylase